MLITAYFLYLKFKIILSKDIHVNPGPSDLRGKLSLATWNINSILARNKSKIQLTEALQANENFDLFGIGESFLSKKIKNKDIEITGFANDPFRADSPSSETHPKGGVCLYYKENIPIKQRKDLQLINECVVAEIKLNRNKNIFFILAYRSPSQNSDELSAFFKGIEQIITCAKNEKPAMIILAGGLNARSPLLWSGETCENSAGKKLSEILIMENMDQIIDEATHHPTDGIETCIDLMITNNPSAVVDHGVSPPSTRTVNLKLYIHK